MLKQRVITAVVLLAALLAAAAAGRVAVDAALAVVLGAAAYEWLRLAQHRRRLCVIAGLALAALLLGLQALGHGLSGRALAMLLAAACAAWLLIALQVLRGAQRGARVPHPLSTLLALFLLPAAWFALMRLMDDGFVYLLSVLAVVWLADIAAYFAGRRWGRRKLAPAISPGKTWEGAAGAVLGVTLYVVLVGVLSLHLAAPLQYAEVVLVAWVLVAISIEGDLFESAIKRQAGVKDSGALLPGHGGMLDRIDALTAALPLAGLLVLLNRLLVSA